MLFSCIDYHAKETRSRKTTDRTSIKPVAMEGKWEEYLKQFTPNRKKGRPEIAKIIFKSKVRKQIHNSS